MFAPTKKVIVYFIVRTVSVILAALKQSPKIVTESRNFTGEVNSALPRC